MRPGTVIVSTHGERFEYVALNMAKSLDTGEIVNLDSIAY